MNWTAVVELAAMSGVVGFGAYCISCAIHVWHVRNARLREREARRGFGSVVRRTSAFLLAAGLLGMIFSAGWQIVVRYEGLLSGDGLFTVLRPADLEVEAVAKQDVVEPDTSLARFASPESAAEVAVLKLNLQRLEAEKQVVLHQPLAVDPEITQKLAELNAEERTLRTTGNNLVLERRRILRDGAREKLVKQDEIQKLHLEISRLEGELEQARSELKRCQEDYERSRALRQRGVVAEEEFSEKASKLASQEIEVAKLEEQWKRRAEQKAELERGLEDFLALNAGQVQDLAADIASVDDQLTRAVAEQKTVLGQRDRDLIRAARHRDECLKRTDVESKQLDEKLAGWQRKLEMTAPFAGQIVYRASSPGSVHPGEPLVVLAPADGLRFRIRLPHWMASPLEHARAVTCELLQDLDRDEQRRFVQSRFSAHLAAWEDLPDHSGYGLAELKCEMPAEAVRLLARGDEIAARLVWRPPLYTSPVFVFSAVLAGVACAAWGASLRGTRSTWIRRPLAVSGHVGNGNVDNTSIEFGAEGAMLRMLGVQLRETIVRGELDLHVLAAAEWALERHRTRAVRLLALGLGDGREFSEHLENFLKEHMDRDCGNRDGSIGAPPSAPERLAAILRAVAPADICEPISRLGRDLSGLSAKGCNGHGNYSGRHSDRHCGLGTREHADR